MSPHPNLCQEGFATAEFLYPRGFKSSVVSCQHAGKPSSLNYFGAPFMSKRAETTILQTIHDHIDGSDHRPILVHCYNGWHASGYMSGIALRQFCAISGRDAWEYWKETAAPGAGVASEREICKSLHDFQPISSLKISSAAQSLLCASFSLRTTPIQDDCDLPAFPNAHPKHALVTPGPD